MEEPWDDTTLVTYRARLKHNTETYRVRLLHHPEDWQLYYQLNASNDYFTSIFTQEELSLLPK